MPQTDSRSLEQIKRETEQTRAGLTNTVEQLKSSVADTASDIRQRISPEAIKAEVSSYIKSRGEQILNDVTVAARRNPMQAIAVGASVAYPLLRLARAIPVPVLMVGAGLFFAGSKTGQSATQAASDVASDLSEEVGRRARELGDRVGETATAAKAYASDQLDRASAAISGGASQASRAADSASTAITANSRALQDQASSFSNNVASRAADFKEQGARMAESAAATARDTAASLGNSLADATGAGLDAARALRDSASELGERAGRTIFQTIEQNPLIVAGAGLLIGGLIASALPRSEIEDGLVGSASSAVKRQAQAKASQGFDAAKNAVGDAFDEATRKAEEEGLSPDGLADAANDLGQRMRRVAESAVTTAFEPEQKNHQPTHGDNQHG